MKAIYNKPLTDIVKLNIQDVLAPKDQAHWSDPYDTADTNNSFFDDADASSGDGKDSFFDD